MAFLRNVADSLMYRTLPVVGKNILGSEFDKYKNLGEKFDNAKELLNESIVSLKSTQSGFSGIGPVTRKFKSQLKSGKFGVDSDYQEKKMSKSFGFDDLDLDSIVGGGDDLTSTDEFGGTNTSVTINNNDIDSYSIADKVGNGISQGDALLNERLSVNASAANLLATQQLHSMANVSASLNNIIDFHVNQTNEFYKASLDFYRTQTSLSTIISEGFPKIVENQAEELKVKATKRQSLLKNQNSEDEDISSILDPQRAMEKLLDSTQFDLLFGDMGIKSVLEQFSDDPLGSVIGMGLTTGINTLFSSQIEFVKHQSQLIEYRLQEVLENWSNDTTDTSPLGFLKRSLGSILKVDRDTDAEISMGTYSNDETPFDVQTKKAIVDVIPMYLSKILKAITNSDSHEIYDWEKGKFDTSENINKRIANEVTKINEGNQVGGLGSNINSLLNDSSLSAEKQKLLKEKILHSSLSRNSTNIRLGELDLDDDELSREYQRLYANMSTSERYDFEGSFSQHKYQRQKEKARYISRLQSTGREQAAIIDDKDYSLDEEHGGIAPTARFGTRNTSDRSPTSDINRTDRETLEQLRRNTEEAARRSGINLVEGSSSSFTNRNRNVLEEDEEEQVELERKELKSEIAEKIENSLFLPIKKWLLGRGYTEDDAKEKRLADILSEKFEEKILVPFKSKLLGKDYNEDDAKEKTLFESFQIRFDNSILFPMKKALLGKDVDNETIKNTTLLQSFSDRFDKSILFPLKKYLVDGNENKAKNFSFWKSLDHKLERTVFFPLKKWLLNGEERSGATIVRTSLFQSLKTGFTEKVIHPLNEMLFGEDKRKLGFWSNLQNTMSPFFNKLLFGAKKANERGFIENLKTESKKLWDFVWKGAKDKFFRPALNTFKEFFGPTLKEFASTIGVEMKFFGKKFLETVGFNTEKSIANGIRVGAKNLFKTVFGDETIKLLQDNVVKPLKDLTKTLTDNMSKVFKFLLRIPLNFFKGVTDSAKLNRIKSGRGNYSPEETARLLNLERSGKVFNFMNLDGDTAHNSINSDPTANNSQGRSLFNTLFGRNNSNVNNTTNNVNTINNQSGLSNVTGNRFTLSNGLNFNRNGLTGLNHTNNIQGREQTLVQRMTTSVQSVTERVRENVSSNLNLNQTFTSVGDNIRSLTTRVGEFTTEVSRLLVRNNEESINQGNINGQTNLEQRDLQRRHEELINSTRTSSNNTLAASATSVANVAKIEHKLDIITPNIVSLSANSMGILQFLKTNLTKVDKRLENIFKAVNKKGRKGRGGSATGGLDTGFFRNPVVWLGLKIQGLFGFGFSILGTLAKTVGQATKAIISIPGKIAGSVSSILASIFNATMKIAGGVIDSLSTAMKGVIKGVGIIAESLATNIGKVVSGITSAVSGLISGIGIFAKEIAGPLAKAAGSIVNSFAEAGSTLIKGLVPIVNTLITGMTKLVDGVFKVTEGLAKFAFRTAQLAGSALFNIGNAAFGGRLINASTALNVGATVKNFSELLLLSKTDPLNVHVVGGHVMTTATKARRQVRATAFNDNVENRITSRREPNNEEGKKKNFVSDLLKNLLGVGSGTVLGTLVSSLLGGIAKGFTGIVGAVTKSAIGRSAIGRVGGWMAGFLGLSALKSAFSKFSDGMSRIPGIGRFFNRNTNSSADVVDSTSSLRNANRDRNGNIRDMSNNTF
ncbi:MAG: hypothetical protein, partial [Bacteriophage sp.]